VFWIRDVTSNNVTNIFLILGLLTKQVYNYGQMSIIIIIGGRTPACSTTDLEETDCWRAFWHKPMPQLCAGGAPWGNCASSSVKHPEINNNILKVYHFLESNYSENNCTEWNAKFVAEKTAHDVTILFHAHSALFGSVDRICSQTITF